MPLLLLLLLTVATYAQPQPPLHDERDGKTYKTVKIGTQIWMAENLNYEAEGSRCYNDTPKKCVKYGRLYNWETALKACPSSWHLPSDEDWEALVNFAGGYKVVNVIGKMLKAKNGWPAGLGVPAGLGKSSNGTDEYGFSALPSGSGSNNGQSFLCDCCCSSWWSTSEYNNDEAYCMAIVYNSTKAFWSNREKSYLLSVRCVKTSEFGSVWLQHPLR